jgi:hypothetical protein
MNKQKTDRRANKVGLFCNARNEIHIKEWAAHHLLIGFDLIIIFDHKSTKPLSKVFANFDKRVTIINAYLEDGNIKQILMTNATNIAIKLNLDWFIYLDADEFLILNNQFKGVKQFLNRYMYGDSIGVNWLMFGSNNLIKEPSGLILENYTRSCKMLNQHVKSFVRPNNVTNNCNPHFYNMRNPYKMLGLQCNILKPPYCFNNINIPYYNSPAYIAHYVFQSEETYKNRKIILRPDDGTNFRCNLKKNIHTLYNNETNLQPQKYIPQIKNFLNRCK